MGSEVADQLERSRQPAGASHQCGGVAPALASGQLRVARSAASPLLVSGGHTRLARTAVDDAVRVDHAPCLSTRGPLRAAVASIRVDLASDARPQPRQPPPGRAQNRAPRELGTHARTGRGAALLTESGGRQNGQQCGQGKCDQGAASKSGEHVRLLSARHCGRCLDWPRRRPADMSADRFAKSTPI